jgi:hypothetical protein
MSNYETVVEALAALKARGYTMDFTIDFDKIICKEKNLIFKPEDFEIQEFYRFEGDTNPSDEDIVFAIESKDGLLKGCLTSAYGTYAEGKIADMIKKIAVHKN